MIVRTRPDAADTDQEETLFAAIAGWNVVVETEDGSLFEGRSYPMDWGQILLDDGVEGRVLNVARIKEVGII